MPPAYTSAQKQAIAQFQSFTNSDKNQAAKFLKTAAWNIEVAVNSFFTQTGAQLSGPLSTLFRKYQDYNESKDEEETLDMAATQQYFKDIGVSVDDVSSFIALAVVKCETIGAITKDGFVEGWSAAGCDSISKQKQFITTNKNTLGTPTNKELMDKVWKNSFSLLLEQGQRSAEKATCIDSWQTLLVKPSFEWKSKSFDWLEAWIKFLEENKSVKGISRDLWNHILKFARETIADESLKFHTDEASWPALIDEFAEHIKEVKGLNKQDDDVEMED